jgi:hypothetical protein
LIRADEMVGWLPLKKRKVAIDIRELDDGNKRDRHKRITGERDQRDISCSSPCEPNDTNPSKPEPFAFLANLGDGSPCSTNSDISSVSSHKSSVIGERLIIELSLDLERGSRCLRA